MLQQVVTFTANRGCETAEMMKSTFILFITEVHRECQSQTELLVRLRSSPSTTVNVIKVLTAQQLQLNTSPGRKRPRHQWTQVNAYDGCKMNAIPLVFLTMNFLVFKQNWATCWSYQSRRENRFTLCRIVNDSYALIACLSPLTR